MILVPCGIGAMGLPHGGGRVLPGMQGGTAVPFIPIRQLFALDNWVWGRAPTWPWPRP